MVSPSDPGKVNLSGACANLIIGRLKNPERMITSKISLDEGLEKGIHALLNEREKHVKILIGVDS